MSTATMNDIPVDATAKPDDLKPPWHVWGKRLAVLLGVVLGVWLSQPVGAIQEEVYLVPPGDSLARVAVWLDVAEEDLISWNQETYPSIAEKRIGEGWELVYYTGGELPRWRRIVDPLLQSKAGQKVVSWVQASFGEVEDEVKIGNIKAAILMADWINYYRKEADMPELWVDPGLQEMAMIRAAVYAGKSSKSLDDHPLCNGCIEIRSNWDSAWSVTKDWRYRYMSVMLGDFEAMGLGHADREGRTRPWDSASAVAIFRTSPE